MFIVKRVRFKNFRSYGNQFTEVNLTKVGSTVITAPNGSGKSTILMAIEFALFGRVSNGITKPDLVNSINKKDCLVEVECETNGRQILVRRGIKPAVFDIEIDGKLVDQDASSRDYQSKFEDEILGFNIASFRQVISISGGSYTPFLLLAAGARRKIVEELLNLTIFSKMASLHLATINQNREELANAENEIGRLQASIQSLKKGLESLAEQEEGYRLTIEANIKTAEDKITAFLAENEEANRRIEEFAPVRNKIKQRKDKRQKLLDFRRDIEKKVSRIDEYVKFFHDHDHCPTCKQGITEEFKQESISPKEAKKAEYAESLHRLEDTLKQTRDDIEKLESILEKTLELEKQVHTTNGRIRDLQAYITQQQRMLKNSSGSGDEIKGEIKAKSEQMENLKERRLTILEEKQYNDIITAIIKDNGIKSKIIAQYVPHMNAEINRYLEILNLNLSFEIDEQFNEKILSRFKDELSYASFSAGERARIDIAILFTWRELAKLKNSLSCNLLFLDEIFDSVLDEEGLESFINLLRYNLKDTNVFLISHRPEVVDKFESNLRIEKQGNFSRIV